jgi:septal ring factor EnvC (AmiA/AmiB activator)
VNKNMTVVLGLVLAAGCTSTSQNVAPTQPMDPTRTVSERDCSKSIGANLGNLLCHQVTDAERRAQAAEEERLARAKKEAAERAERERLERERAEQLAREEAARKARLAEEERLAAERRRAEAAAAAAAAAERERQARAEAEARAKREAAERECKRLAQERNDGRALLASFVSKYGKADEFKEIAGQISAFLDKTATAKPCP